MKKFIFALAAAALAFVGCQKASEVSLPELSFETALPSVVDGTATYTLSTSYTGAETVKVPVKFTSADGAVLGTDYTVSAEEFVLGGENSVTAITLTPLVYGSKKSVTATISVPDGFKAGKYSSSTITLSDKIGYVSFSSKKAVMTDGLTIPVNIYNAEGSVCRVETATEIEVSVNTEKSTAVEGTNFKFSNGAKATVDAGKNSGNIALEMVGDLDESHNTIVLDLKNGAKFGEGQYTQITVQIAGSAWKLLSGKWVIKEIVDSLQEFYDYAMETAESMAGYPAFNQNDSFTLNFETGEFIPDFKSSLKNYFVGKSNFTSCGEPMDWPNANTKKGYNIQLGMSRGYKAKVIELDNVNRYFSETATSESKLAYVGLYLDDDGTLRMFIIDHESRSFLLNSAESWGGVDYLYNSCVRPTANLSQVGFEVDFTKANN